MIRLTKSAQKLFFEAFRSDRKHIQDHLTSHGFRHFSRPGEYVYIKGHKSYCLVKDPTACTPNAQPMWLFGFNRIGVHDQIARRLGI
jgi:hypothetical protein